MNGLRRGASLVRRYAILEVKLYAALARWCLRRKDVPAGAEPWGYAQLVTPMLWLWVFGSATELVVLHLIIPWERIRFIVDLISVWGLFWMLGTLAAYRIRPHLLLHEQLRVRSGVYHDIVIPKGAIASASVREADLPSAMFTLHVEAGDNVGAGENAAGEKGDQVSLGVSGRTNVVVRLRAPTPIPTAKGVVPAGTVRLWVDEPRQFVARLNADISQDCDRLVSREEDAAT